MKKEKEKRPWYLAVRSCYQDETTLVKSAVDEILNDKEGMSNIMEWLNNKTPYKKPILPKKELPLELANVIVFTTTVEKGDMQNPSESSCTNGYFAEDISIG